MASPSAIMCGGVGAAPSAAPAGRDRRAPARNARNGRRAGADWSSAATAIRCRCSAWRSAPAPARRPGSRVPAPMQTKPTFTPFSTARAAKISCLGAPSATKHSRAPDAAMRARQHRLRDLRDRSHDRVPTVPAMSRFEICPPGKIAAGACQHIGRCAEQIDGDRLRARLPRQRHDEIRSCRALDCAALQRRKPRHGRTVGGHEASPCDKRGGIAARGAT